MSDAPILGFVATVAATVKPALTGKSAADFQAHFQEDITSAIDAMLKAVGAEVTKGETHLACIQDPVPNAPTGGAPAKCECPVCGPGPVNYSDPLTCGKCGAVIPSAPESFAVVGHKGESIEGPLSLVEPATPAEDPFESMRDQVDEDAIKFDDLDAAIIGYGQQHGSKTVLIYSARKILEGLVKQGMDEEGAQEWFDHNIECLYAGPGTPIIFYEKE
jgi:hypothetical protein